MRSAMSRSSRESVSPPQYEVESGELAKKVLRISSLWSRSDALKWWSNDAQKTFLASDNFVGTS